MLIQGTGLRRSRLKLLRKLQVYRFLRLAVKVTGLTRISPYWLTESTGFVIIAESHVSVHLYGDVAFIDIFSCRHFDWPKVVLLARKIFGGSWTVFGGEPLRRDGP